MAANEPSSAILPLLPQPAPLQTACPASLDSRMLLQGGREVLIRHGEECYRLRHTRNGKLILTK